MANLARNPSVETDYGLTLTSTAYRLTDSANTGSYSIALVGTAAFGGSQGIVEWELTKCQPGTTVTISAAVHELSASSKALQLFTDEGDGTLAQAASISSGTYSKGNWHWWGSGYSFTALGETIRVQFRAQRATTSSWYVDDIIVEGTPVAVLLAERSVDAVVSLLQTNLATELAALDTNYSNDITLAAPATTEYYKREKKEIAGATVHVEVFEEDWTFENPYSDADAQRATYDLPVVVRVTCFNRNADTADNMHKRKRRYAAAVFNVINKNSDLGDSDDATLNVVVTDIETEADRDAEDNIAKVRSTVRLLIKCEEVQ